MEIKALGWNSQVLDIFLLEKKNVFYISMSDYVFLILHLVLEMLEIIAFNLYSFESFGDFSWRAGAH